ncbi:MAG: NAD(P)/FAD-dependent oxidoreductase [Myxococcales bacterium]|nr:MAG: NAD(P)/FAD-dependent oxidoreductase [Myxococcales bacterium]
MPQNTAIIGAGSSGLTVLKALREAGVPAVCFERGSKVGGNWVFGNDNQQSRIYRSLRINTSRERMQFSDFPMPADYPDYASHEQVARYFEAYAEAFDLKPGIRFRSTVERVEPSGSAYMVRTNDGQAHRFDAVIVANGHHWDPAFPEPRPPGHFDGITLHSHHYVSPREPFDLAGRRVVVVGLGNSAVDIASELGRSGAQVALSVRRGAWVLPKHAFGRPIDRPGIIPKRLPAEVKTTIAELWYRWQVGTPASYGLPLPDHRLGHAHPTLSDDLLPLLREGKITAYGAIQRLDGDRVHFAGGRSFQADAVVYCTGYHVTFPFFEPAFVSAPDNELPLFLRCFHLEHRGLMFAGLAQPLGAIMPLVEAQGRLFASYLRGDYELPDPEEMRERARREREQVRRRFVASRRHTMQVDFDGYLEDVARELRAGHRRSGA